MLVATQTDGAALKEFLASHRIDEEFAADVASAREVVTDEMSAAWPDA